MKTFFDSLDPEQGYDLFVGPGTYIDIFKHREEEVKTLRLGNYPIKLKVSKFIPENCIIVFTTYKDYLFRWTGKEMELIKEEESYSKRAVLNWWI